MYPIGTLAKAFTASAVGILVDEAKLKWSSRIRDLLPDFQSVEPMIAQNLTVADLLCHRGGLARSNHWWLGAEGELLLKKSQTIPFYNTLSPAGTFRGDWAYSNWGYAVIGEVIERLSGMEYGDFVSQKIFQPLNLRNTTTKGRQSTTVENMAKPYAALDDGSLYPLPEAPFGDGTIMVPAQGGSSTANDLLKYSIALLEAQQYETEGGNGSSAPLLKNAVTQLSGKIYTAKSMLEKSYAFGFYRSQLPSTITGMGWNAMYVKKMPKLTPGVQSGPVVAHGGSLAGYHSSLALLPELNASIVVCTNSIGLGDASGWISMAIIEALIDTPKPTDFVAYATEAAKGHVESVSSLSSRLEEARDTTAALSKPLAEYAGRYYDRVHDWVIEIRLKEGGSLEVAFQGLDSQAWPLNHYEHNTFLWLASRNEQAKRGRMTTYPLTDVFKLVFQSNDKGVIDRVCWPHEPALPLDKQCFIKDIST